MYDFDIIETPENVNLERRLAGIGTRFLAGMIDHFVMALIFVVFFIFLAIFGGQMDFSSIVGVIAWTILIILSFLVYWCYFLFFEMVMNGQTPGKRYMKIRVVEVEGASVTFVSLAIRNLMRVVDVMGGYAVAGISMFLTKRVQRLGDLAAGTVVISEQVSDYSAKYDKKRKVLDEACVYPEGPEAGMVKPQEFRALASYWLRKNQLDLNAKERILPKLLKPVLERKGVNTAMSFNEMERFVGELMSAAKSEQDSDNQSQGAQ